MKKYQVIYKDLEKAIHSKEYQVGDFLPTEQELVETFQVSRDTIRKALALLVEEGLVKKIHGSGSQVISQEQVNFPVSDLTSYQELIEQQGIKSQTNVISLDKIIVDTNLSEKTGFSKSQQVWRLIRQRVVDGCASVVDIDYLDARLMPQLNRSIAENSIYDYLKFKIHSAAKSVHHGYIGGLLEHSVSVAKLCEQYAVLYPQLNRDLLVTTALFHDIGKAEEQIGRAHV